MTLTEQIIAHAASLFDVVGIDGPPDGGNLLIMGLESTEERNLDEFERLNDRFHLRGFKKHVAERLESVLDYIRRQGFPAELVGHYGYPNYGVLNLKKAAVRAGLGQRGKSTVVLHPLYGTRLRFMAIRTDAPLEPTAPVTAEADNPACCGCSICIDACPVNALEPYHMPDTSICLSNIDIMKAEQGRLIPCDICLHLCPAAGDQKHA